MGFNVYRRLLQVVALSLAAVLAVAMAATPTGVSYPQQYVSTDLVPFSGTIIKVARDGDFQAALDQAQPNDVIELEAGSTYLGPFTLPWKAVAEAGQSATDSSPWIVIRSSAIEDLPPPGGRVDPSMAHLMPKLVTDSGPVLITAAGAHHYRFIGIEMHPVASDTEAVSRPGEGRGDDRGDDRGDANQSGDFITNLVQLGDGETTAATLPHHFIFDRNYLHGDPVAGTRRGIAMNSRDTAVIDSYLTDFMERGNDSQAIASWNGTGPFKIVNNYLQAAGENIMFGGAVATIPDLVPADIEIRQNHFFKPLHWRESDPAYAGDAWSVKNLLELKNARRVLIDGNVFEHNWPHGQNGFAILFTVRNEDGAMPWAVVEDVRFSNNLLRRIGNGINILGRDDNGKTSQVTSRILIANNLFTELGGEWGGGLFLQLLDGVDALTVEHNTVFNSGSIIMSDGLAHQHFIAEHNILQHNDYGITGSGSGPGMPALLRYFPGASITGNLVVGGVSADYPADNRFPDSLQAVGFMDIAGADFRLDPTRSFQSRQQAEPGVDMRLLCESLSRIEQLHHCTIYSTTPSR